MEHGRHQSVRRDRPNRFSDPCPFGPCKALSHRLRNMLLLSPRRWLSLGRTASSSRGRSLMPRLALAANPRKNSRRRRSPASPRPALAAWEATERLDPGPPQTRGQSQANVPGDPPEPARLTRERTARSGRCTSRESGRRSSRPLRASTGCARGSRGYSGCGVPSRRCMGGRRET